MKKRGLLICFLLLIVGSGLSAKTIKVGYHTNLGNLMSGNEYEDRYGYAYEYLQNISAYTGWTFEYKYGVYDELYEALLSGEIDMLPDVSFTEDRKNQVLFPDYSMGDETYYLYAKSKDFDVSLDDLSSLNGKKITVGQGSTQFDLFMDWIQKNNVKFDLTVLPYHQVTNEMLNSGDNDLYLSFDLASQPQWEPIVKIGTSQIYLAVNKNKPELLDELNNALNSIYASDPYYNNALWAQYFSKAALTKKLSSKEIAWLNQKQSITVGCLKDDQPYAGTNKKNGNAEGLLVYLMEKMMDSYNLQIPVIYKFYDSINKIYKAINNDEIDLAFPLIYNVFEAENRNLSLSKKLLNASIGYVHEKGTVLKNSGLTIAVPQGRRSEDFLLQMSMLENDELITYENYEECLKAVLNHEVDGVVFNLNQIQNVIYGRRKYNKLVVTEFSEQIPMCFAMKHNNVELLSIINKFISTTNSSEIQNVVLSKSLNDRKYTVKTFFADYLGLILGLLSVFAIVFIALMIALTYVRILINHDSLTKLLNRRSLNPHIKKFVTKADSHGESFSIMIFDLDNFKQINDVYGHSCGDEVLKMASSRISKGVKHGDFVFRWGGEEFLVITNGDKSSAVETAENIRKDIEKQIVRFDNKNISITATIGVASYPIVSETELFIKADENLYKGKNNGKNQVVAD